MHKTKNRHYSNGVKKRAWRKRCLELIKIKKGKDKFYPNKPTVNTK